MPEGEIDAIGDNLPELCVLQWLALFIDEVTDHVDSTLLGFPAKTNAYYIRCHGCHQRFAKDPNLWKEWQKEMQATHTKLVSRKP
jgi:SWI/SNF-related matrix-associated actin-dependent regulator of chromatin subfamily A member 5